MASFLKVREQNHFEKDLNEVIRAQQWQDLHFITRTKHLTLLNFGQSRIYVESGQ